VKTIKKKGLKSEKYKKKKKVKTIKKSLKSENYFLKKCVFV
jgi:hypothetical protein